MIEFTVTFICGGTCGGTTVSRQKLCELLADPGYTCPGCDGEIPWVKVELVEEPEKTP